MFNNEGNILVRYLIRFSYDGSNFFGYQKQVDKRTIQGELERVLKQISNSDISVSASGRTDALVHALNQYAHFDLGINISCDNLKKALNSLLPKDIYVKCVSIVSESFHARFNVSKKEYIYKINLGEFDPFRRNYIYQYNHKLDVDKMLCALEYFKGKHNFKSFAKSNNDIVDYEREIYDANIKVSDNILEISFIGNGFLRYMVRNMVGTLISVGEGKTKPQEIAEIFNFEDRTKAKKTAPANGLYLKDVYYDEK